MVKTIKAKRDTCFNVRGKKRRYLKEFAQSGRLDKSAEIVGIHRNSHYDWLEADPQYVTDFEAAKEMAADHCESLILKRGFGEGKEGEKTSDLLAIFQMKKMRHAYRDNYSIDLNVKHTLSGDDARAAIAAMLERNPKLIELVGDGEIIDAECDVEGGGTPNEASCDDQ